MSRKSRKTTARRSATKSPTEKRIESQPPLTGRTRLLFWIVTVSLPILLLGVLEVALRAFNVGPDLSLCAKTTLNGREYRIMNPEVSRRYFSRVEFTPSTSPDYFLAEKPAQCFRVFCLGGSTTVGYPYWFNGAFSSFLRQRLQVLFPERQIEVVNLGMTATNSTTVLDIARDVLHYAPDLLIVYDGHNEFYGALGVGSNESASGARWITQAYLRLIRLKTFVALRSLYGTASSIVAPSQKSLPESRGTMMEKLARGQTIPYRGPVYQRGLETFQANIRDLSELCRSAGVPLILATQVSNLKDQPPFVSDDPTRDSGEQRLIFEEAVNSGIEAYLNGNIASALDHLRQASAANPTHAEVHYRMAQCLERLGRPGAAAGEYRQARDLDQLRFRTSSDFNDVIASADDGARVRVVDMERVFAAHSPDSLIGRNLITEHLHPVSAGHFLMAKAYAQKMREMELVAGRTEWDRLDTVSDERLWGERQVTEFDERLANRRTAILTSGWPFTSTVPVVPPVPATDTLGLLVEQVARGELDWKSAYTRAIQYYALHRDTVSVEHGYRALVGQIPQDVQGYLQLAKFYLDCGRTEEMATTLRRSLDVSPTLLAYRALGDLALRSANPGDAIPMYEKALTFEQSLDEKAEHSYLLALAFLKAEKPEQALNLLKEIRSIAPGFQPAVQLLQRLGVQ